jgi:hypothetical protein
VRKQDRFTDGTVSQSGGYIEILKEYYRYISMARFFFLLTGFVDVSHFCCDKILKKVDWAQK